MFIIENSSHEYPLSSQGLEWVQDSFPNTEMLNLHLVGPTTLPNLRNLRELFLHDIGMDFLNLGRLICCSVFLEVYYYSFYYCFWDLYNFFLLFLSSFCFESLPIFFCLLFIIITLIFVICIYIFIIFYSSRFRGSPSFSFLFSLYFFTLSYFQITKHSSLLSSFL